MPAREIIVPVLFAADLDGLNSLITVAASFASLSGNPSASNIQPAKDAPTTPPARIASAPGVHLP